MLVLNKEELADCKDMFTNAQAQMRFGTLRATINSLHLDLVSVAALTAILGEVSSTNHDPSLLAGYYMACVEQLSGCPRMVWAGWGTENGILAALHQVFHNDANNQQMYGHRYVTSTSNQRIEAWLSNLRFDSIGCIFARKPNPNLLHSVLLHGHFAERTRFCCYYMERTFKKREDHV